jgi:hypothetical protein
MKITKIISILFFLLVFIPLNSYSQQEYNKHKIYDVKNLNKVGLCLSDSNLIYFAKIDTVKSTLTFDLDLDSLRITKPGKISYLHFLLNKHESCVVPVKIWIKKINKFNNNVIDNTQYIESNIAFLHSDYNHVSFSEEPIELENNNYQIVVKFYSYISRKF